MKRMFNRLFTATVLLTLLGLLVSCKASAPKNLTPVFISPIEVEHDGVTYVSDPRLDLLLIALRLAENPRLYNNYYGATEYVSAADSFFEKHKDHELVKMLRPFSKMEDFRFEALINIAFYISDDFTQITFPQGKCPEFEQTVWKKINLNKFIAAFNDFAVTTKFDRFLMVNDAFIKRELYDAREFFTVNDTVFPYIREYFELAEGNQNVTCCTSSFLAGRFGASQTLDSQNNNTVRFLFSPYYGYDVGNEAYFLEFFTESLSYFKIFADWEKTGTAIKNFAKNVYVQTQNTEKVEDYSSQCLLSSLISIVFLLDFAENAVEAEKYEDILNYFYNEDVFQPYMPLGLKIKEFFANRDSYKDFYDFYDKEMPGILESL